MGVAVDEAGRDPGIVAAADVVREFVGWFREIGGVADPSDAAILRGDSAAFDRAVWLAVRGHGREVGVDPERVPHASLLAPPPLDGRGSVWRAHDRLRLPLLVLR